MDKQKIKTCLIEIVFFVVELSFAKFCLFGFIKPLLFVFVLIRIFYGSNLLVTMIEYAAINIVAFLNVSIILTMIYEIVILSLFYFCKNSFKIRKENLLLMITVLISTMPNLYYSIFNQKMIIEYLINFSAKILALFFFKNLFIEFKKKQLFFKFSSIDYFLFTTFILFVSIGLFSYGSVLKYFGFFIVSFIVLFLCRIMPPDKFLIASISVAGGYSLLINNLVFLYYAVGMMFFCLSIVNFNKFMYLFLNSVVLACVFIINNLYAVSSIVQFVCAVLICGVVKQKQYIELSKYFEEKTVNLLQENLKKEQNKDLKFKLGLMAKTLFNMKDCFRFLIVGKIDRKKAAEELSKDIVNKCCTNCEHFNFCQKTNIDKSALISEYIFYAMNKGDIFVDELGTNFKTYCVNQNLIVNEINQISKLYLAYESKSKAEDESKLLVSYELENFAKLFVDFSKKVDESSWINKNISKMLKQSILNNMIDVDEVCVVETKDGIERIDIVAGNEVIVRRELLQSLERVIKNKVKLQKLKHLDFSGMSLASFVLTNSLNIDFAVSAKARAAENGDNFSIVKIDENKFFVAIADGMGHGTMANKTSKMVLELVKSLFVVGIDFNTIIESINKLFIPVGLDNFTTLDSCILDLNRNIATFIKLGSSVSILKHTNTSEIISCDSLPVGIVKDIRPTIITKRLCQDDVIILASDGVVDSFNNVESYKIFINDLKLNNLQKSIDDIIFEIEYKNQTHKDDMSMIAIKLLKNL